MLKLNRKDSKVEKREKWLHACAHCIWRLIGVGLWSKSTLANKGGRVRKGEVSSTNRRGRGGLMRNGRWGDEEKHQRDLRGILGWSTRQGDATELKQADDEKPLFVFTGTVQGGGQFFGKKEET